MRPMIIGMNNPINTSPGFELYPAPAGCTGHRLWSMLNERRPEVSRRTYLDVFERRNLVNNLVFDRGAAEQEAARIYASLWGSGRTVVLLGRDVQKAFGIPPLLIHPQTNGGTVYRQLPHPSGRNMWYNDQKNRELAAVLLDEIYTAYIKENNDDCH